MDTLNIGIFNLNALSLKRSYLYLQLKALSAFLLPSTATKILRAIIEEFTLLGGDSGKLQSAPTKFNRYGRSYSAGDT